MAEKILKAEKAKQARQGWRVLMVLIGALVLAMIAWFAVETFVKTSDETTSQANLTTSESLAAYTDAAGTRTLSVFG